MDKFISVKPLDSQLKPGQKVLRSVDYQQLVGYEDLLRQLAVRDKERQVQATEALSKSIRHGMAEGMEQANQQLAEQLLTFTLQMHESLRQVERSLADVVIEAVRKIVHDFDNETLVKNTVRSGLELVRGGKKLTIRVHPQMQEVVSEQLGELQKSISHVEVLSDSALKLDECILESDVGIVNASVDLQVEALVSALRKAFPE
ncbi:MAG: type III secretion system stator protein SctL [Thiolinea sp.]